MKQPNNFEKMMNHNIRPVTLMPGTFIGNYDPIDFQLITGNYDFRRAFPTQITDFTRIGVNEYDVIKKYFPAPREDANGVKCLIPVEEHLANGIKLSPRAYINMAYHDPELFEKYTEGRVNILGAQFCPIDNSYRNEYETDDGTYTPLGVINITCSWKWTDDMPFTISQLICMRNDTLSYSFFKVFKINNVYQIMLVHNTFFRSNNPEFNDDFYKLFAKVIPCVSRESMRLWDSIQYMSLHPKLKEVFFSEKAPIPSYCRKPFHSGMDLRKIENVKYVYVDIPKHHELVEDNPVKRSYTRRTGQWPAKGYTRVRNGKEEYVRPSKRGPEKDKPLEKPVEVKLA